MRWREYPDQATRRRDTGALPPQDGTERAGTLWAAGPVPGSCWVMPDGDESRFALVHTPPAGPGRRWSVTEEDWQRQPAGKDTR
jgi:hypothetical protein